MMYYSVNEAFIGGYNCLFYSKVWISAVVCKANLCEQNTGVFLNPVKSPQPSLSLSLSLHFEVSPSTYIVEPFLLPEVFLRVHFLVFTSCLGLNFSVFVSSFRSEYTLKERSEMFGSDLLFLEAYYFLLGMGLPSSSSFPLMIGGGGGGLCNFLLVIKGFQKCCNEPLQLPKVFLIFCC